MLKPVDKLTERERALLSLVAPDRSLDELAYLLGISTGTVKVHVRNINRKLRTNTRHEAARIFRTANGDTSSSGIPRSEVATVEPDSGQSEVVAEAILSERPVDELREAQMPFRHFEAAAEETPDQEARSTARPILMAVAFAALIAMLIVLAPLMGESFQKLANLLEPPKHD